MCVNPLFAMYYLKKEQALKFLNFNDNYITPFSPDTANTLWLRKILEYVIPCLRSKTFKKLSSLL